MTAGVVVSEAIKRGGDPALVANTAVSTLSSASYMSVNGGAPTGMLRSEILSLVKNAGGDVSGQPSTPGGTAVERVMQDMKMSPGVFANLNDKSQMQFAIQQYGAQNLATALALTNGPASVMQMVNAITGNMNGATGVDTKIASEAAATIEAIIKGTVAADPANTTTSSVQASVTEALIANVKAQLPIGPEANLLKELSKTVSPEKLAAIASQFSQASAISGTYNMALNVNSPLTVAAQLGIPLSTLTQAVVASGFTSPTGFARTVDDGNGGKKTEITFSAQPGSDGNAQPVGDTAAAVLIRLAGNSDTDLKTVLAAVKASGGSTEAYITAAIEAGVDPAKVTAATASGSPTASSSPAPAPAPVAGPAASPSPGTSFSGAAGSTISGGGGGAVSKS